MRKGSSECRKVLVNDEVYYRMLVVVNEEVYYRMLKGIVVNEEG